LPKISLLKGRWLILFGILLLFAECKREKTTWDVDLLFPVAHGRITLVDLIPDSLLELDPDGVTHLIYEDDVFNLELDSLFTIPDTNIRESFLFPVPGGPFVIEPGFEVVALEETFNFDMEDIQMREVDVKTGTVYYIANNYIDGQLLLDYEIPGVTKDGESFRIQTIIAPGSGTDPSTVEGVLDLSGYHMDLTGPDGIQFNELLSITNVSVDPDAAEAATVFGGDSVNIELFFVSPSIEYAKGYFGNEFTEVDDTSSFDAMSSLISGGLVLNDISIDLDLINYVGADASVTFDGIKAINSEDGTSVSLSHPTLGDAINITRAFENNGDVIPTSYSFSLNSDNSNVLDFIELLPDQLAIDGEFEINPLGNVSASNDFIYSEKPIEALVRLDLPLCIGLDSFTLRDSLQIDFDEELNASGVIRLYAVNGFPFSANVDVQVVDPDEVTLASLVATSSLDAGVDTGDEVIGTESIIQLELSEGDVGEINSGNQLVITVVFDTSGEEAKLAADHYLDLKIVADVNGEVGYE
jgi:hypothetical protein